MAFQSNLTRFAASCLALLACMPAPAATTAELLRLTDRLDQMDQMDFDQAIDKANKCIQARDFSCSEAQLKAARKLAATSAAKDHLRRTETLQRAEKEAVEIERQALARRQRALEEEERRLQAAEERAARQAASAEEEESGMSTAQGAALFGSLLAQAYKGQAAARMAEAAQGRRIQQQLEASRADVARNQQRFAEERARIEAQRARLLQQQQQPQQVRQQAQLPREQEAAATQRAQLAQAQRQEVDANARATAQAESPNRSAQTLVAAANTRTSTSNTPAGSSAGSGSANVAHDSRIKRYGTMYVVHYAALKHSRSDKKNLTLIGRITPVSWTYDVPRVSQQQEASGRSDTVPYQVSDLLLKQMRPKFMDYVRDKYTICNESGPKPDGCYVSSKYHQIGNSAAEVQDKLNAMLPSFSAPVTNDSGLNYPPSIAYSE